MAFNCATGKHRRPGRTKHTAANAMGVAALTATGVIGAFAGSASAAGSPVRQTGLLPVIDMGNAVAAQIEAQADAQQEAADKAAARKAAEQAVKKRTAEAKADKVRATRAAERKRLNTYVVPVAGSYVSTGYMTSGSVWSSGTHTGIDFHAATGTSVRSVGYGTVVQAGWGGAYGNQIVIKMHDGTYTQYGHLSSIGVSVGQKVAPGQYIALSGATGNVTGPHLHFEARTTPEYGSDIDPVAYLRAHGVDV